MKGVRLYLGTNTVAKHTVCCCCADVPTEDLTVRNTQLKLRCRETEEYLSDVVMSSCGDEQSLLVKLLSHLLTNNKRISLSNQRYQVKHILDVFSCR